LLPVRERGEGESDTGPAFILARQESLHPSPEALTQAAESRQTETAMSEV
jgi:hypothetical protein